MKNEKHKLYLLYLNVIKKYSNDCYSMVKLDDLLEYEKNLSSYPERLKLLKFKKLSILIYK